MITLETPEAHVEHSESTDSPSISHVNTDSISTPNETTEATIHDPGVATLHSMFPDFEISILASVLESVSGDHDRAIDVLLGMSDPSYKPIIRPDATQTELDEEFARHLMLEEQSRQQATWRPQYPSRDNPPRIGTQSPGNSDSVAQIQEHLGKFAETSKRTLGTFFSKVKAKIQELDNPANESGRSASSQQTVASPPRQSSYQPPSQVLAESGLVRGYDVEAHAQTSHGSFHEEPSSRTRTPPTSIDPSFVGLLPKRPVTLDSSPQPSTAGPTDNDDELEYVTNPFEESDKK
ncbi:hypothetical protein Clacol_000524 [Clathrus columnatus]|uniref:CUE domain-containing protein n=1 Tax=Clathrus columnatus TaxID=1419009 RepID=A0AAV4ZYQ7_9AGAM|nr:hypothetical protein Clacol_000524 [Clathrus columnatus]